MAENDYKGLPYKMSKFSISLNAFPGELANVILPSDSRRRLDRYYLERGYSDIGTQWKKVGEYRQREDHRQQGDSTKKEKEEPYDHWTPLWFVSGKAPDQNQFWEWSGKYWEFRQKRQEETKTGEVPWNLSIDGKACDFAAYGKLWGDLLGKELIPQADLERAAIARTSLQDLFGKEGDAPEDSKSPRSSAKKG